MIDIRDASLQAIGYAAEMELLNDKSSLDDYRKLVHVAIEDARHDNKSGTWTIGVGFVRPWDKIEQPGSLASLLSDTSLSETRTVKHVRLNDETGELIAYY